MKKKKVKIRKRCSIVDCKRRVTTTHECRTCERLELVQDFDTSPKVMYACDRHYEAVVALMKRHAVTKHPLNLLRVFAGMLKGEEW